MNPIAIFASVLGLGMAVVFGTVLLLDYVSKRHQDKRERFLKTGCGDKHV